MRAALLLDSDPAAAARRAGDILADSPEHPEANLLFAAACRKLGDPSAAAAALEWLVQAHPGIPLMQLELGRAYAASGRSAEARDVFQRAVALDEGLAEGWRELAAMSFATGEILGGDTAYARYSRLSSDPPALSDAFLALAENRLAVAEAMLRRRLGQVPHDVVALRMLADVAARSSDHRQAERWLVACLDIAPGFAGARYDLAQVLHAQDRNSEVLPLVDRLLAAEPRNIDCLRLKAQALRLLNRNDEAIALMEQAVADQPDEHAAWLLYGHLLREVGQQARAIDAYRQALAIHPQSGRAYASLANLKTFRFTAEDRTAMQAQLAHAAPRGAERIHLEFALGKALEDEGRFAVSFEHYARGNVLHRSTIRHNADAITAEVQRSMQLFTARFFAQRSGWGSERRDPIFIVGLPRSGSTLLEQILSSHSQVEGTRELSDIPAIGLELSARPNSAGPTDYLESVGALGRQNAQALAASYLSRTQVYRPLNKPRFVDKMLGNFAHLALIHLMFPHAAIIDARRHPLGCGFSCYKQIFPRELGFAYDLSELGRHYRDYAELMQHFDTVLPKRVHRIYYEQLVADPPGEVQKLLDYCGLPFEQQCLHFYENSRVVHTISSEQVRRPIYSDSVDQWRHYEPWLGPLKDALDGWLERYPPA